jgi:hypothetical protein
MTMSARMNARRVALVATLIFQGLSGLAGGFGLLRSPSGEGLGLPASWLEGSPFNDYLIPGIVLFLALGLAPLVVAWGTWMRRSWSQLAALAVGAALVVWIAVQILIIGYQPDPPLQAVYGGVGVAIVGLALVCRARTPLHRGRSHER